MTGDMVWRKECPEKFIFFTHDEEGGKMEREKERERERESKKDFRF